MTIARESDTSSRRTRRHHAPGVVDWRAAWVLSRIFARMARRSRGARRASAPGRVWTGRILFGLFFAAAGMLAGDHLASDPAADGLRAALFIFGLYFSVVTLLDHSAVLALSEDFRAVAWWPISPATYHAGRLGGSARTLGGFILLFTCVAIMRGGLWSTPRDAVSLTCGVLGDAAAILLGATALHRFVAPYSALHRGQVRLVFLQTVLLAGCFGGLWTIDRLLGPPGTPLPDWLTGHFSPVRWFSDLGLLANGNFPAWPGAALAGIVLVIAGWGALHDGEVAFPEALFAPERSHTLPDRSWERTIPESEPNCAGAGDLPPPSLLGRILFPERGGALFRLVQAHLRDARVLPPLVATAVGALALTMLTLHGRSVHDPFLRPAGDPIDWSFAYFYTSVVFFLLHALVDRSVHHRAAWIFHSAALDPRFPLGVIRRTARVLVLYPFLFLVFVLLAVHYGHPQHALFHVAFIAAGAELAVALLAVRTARHPFSGDPRTGGGRSGRFLTTVVAALVFAPSLATIQTFAFRCPENFLGAVAALTAAAAVTNRLVDRWQARRLARLEWVS